MRYLESRGPRVLRTDGALAFVQMLRAAGHQARLLDVRTDDFGGPYDAVLADAVLLHVPREQFEDVLQRARQAVTSGGVLAITLKEGDGEAWTEAKLGRPRHFTYWREPAVRAALLNSGWQVLSLEHVEGRAEPWLFVTARTVRCRANLLGVPSDDRLPDDLAERDLTWAQYLCVHAEAGRPTQVTYDGPVVPGQGGEQLPVHRCSLVLEAGHDAPRGRQDHSQDDVADPQLLPGHRIV